MICGATTLWVAFRLSPEHSMYEEHHHDKGSRAVTVKNGDVHEYVG